MECKQLQLQQAAEEFNLAHSTIYNPELDVRWKSYNQTVMPEKLHQGSLRKRCWKHVAVFPISHLQQNIKRTRAWLIAPKFNSKGSLKRFIPNITTSIRGIFTIFFHRQPNIFPMCKTIPLSQSRIFTLLANKKRITSFKSHKLV